MDIDLKKKISKKWFIQLQNMLCNSIEELEKEFGSNTKFTTNRWKHGQFKIIKGKVIEKGGVAFSNVVGKLPKKFAKGIPGTNKNIYHTIFYILNNIFYYAYHTLALFFYERFFFPYSLLYMA